jgi:hypothetical protein
MAAGWWSRNGHHNERGPSTHPIPPRRAGRAGSVFKNGKLIERPDESEGGDQQVA